MKTRVLPEYFPLFYESLQEKGAFQSVPHFSSFVHLSGLFVVESSFEAPGRFTGASHVWCGLPAQVQSRLSPLSAQRLGAPCCSAAPSPQQRSTSSVRCAGTTGTTTSCWRTSRAAPWRSAIKTPACTSPPRTKTAAPSPSRRCVPTMRAASAAYLMCFLWGGRRP